jgi:hypothetical protein
MAPTIPPVAAPAAPKPSTLQSNPARKIGPNPGGDGAFHGALGISSTDLVGDHSVAADIHAAQGESEIGPLESGMGQFVQRVFGLGPIFEAGNEHSPRIALI